MLFNSTSSFDDNLHYFCSDSGITFISIGMMALKTALVVPLCLFILRLGFQQWRPQRSFKAASHCDLFTYHLALMELFWGPGCMFYLCGVHYNNLPVILLGRSAFSLTFFGEILFHALTCVERYLAVVHPIFYRTLRNARGIRVREIAIGCVWLLCLGLVSLHVDPTASHVNTAVLIILVSAVVAVTFCCISVLRILMHPGPGGGRGDKARVDQSKQRAFYTITTILGALGLWLLCLLASIALSKSSQLEPNVGCVAQACVNWLNLPISLMGPLFYLNRYRKRSCCW